MLIFQLRPVTPGPHKFRKVMLHDAMQGVGDSLLVEKPNAAFLGARHKRLEPLPEHLVPPVVDDQSHHPLPGVCHAHLLQPRCCDDFRRHARRHCARWIPPGEERAAPDHAIVGACVH